MVAHNNGRSNSTNRWADIPFMTRNEQSAKQEKAFEKHAVQTLKRVAGIFGEQICQKIDRREKKDKTRREIQPEEQSDNQVF